MNKNADIEKRLKAEIEQSVPDVWENVLSGIDKKDSGTVISFPQKNKKRPVMRTLTAVAAALAIVFASYFGLFSSTGATFDVEFDVNPGVILEIDKNEKVTDVITLNDDAAIVLDDMDLKGSNLNVAVNALMFSIIKHGYIDEMTNSVLVTVSDDAKNQSEITKEIAQQINSAFEESSIQGSVVVQTLKKDAELEKLASDYNITVGKAALIKNLVESGKTSFTYDVLASLCVNELNILMNEKNATDNVTVIGTASQKAYIGEEAAKGIAYAAASVNNQDVKHVECELDLDNTTLVYDVEFIVSGAIYECEVDALTGEVYDLDIEPVNEAEITQSETATEIAPTVTFKTKEEIKQLILEKNGFASSECKNFEIELDYDDGIAMYEVDFIYGNTEYEYEVNAVNGSIISFSSKDVSALTTEQPVSEPSSEQTTAETETAQITSETQFESVSEPSETQSEENSNKGFIGNEKAKSIALSHAGISQYIKTEIEFGFNGGIVYCVEFDYDGMEYEYEINAKTGEIVDFEKEADD